MATARETWQTLTTLRAHVATSEAINRYCADLDSYARLRDLVLAARAVGTYAAYTELYTTLCGRYSHMEGRQVWPEGAEWHVPSACVGIFHGAVLGNTEPVILPPEELAAALTQKAELEALFETRNTTDMTDAVYGRRSWGTFYTPTGEQVAGGRDREGSLGT